MRRRGKGAVCSVHAVAASEREFGRATLLLLLLIDVECGDISIKM